MPEDIIKTHFSLTVSGIGNNNHCSVKGGELTDFLSWYKPRRHGRLKLAIKYFNRIYSTGCGAREEKGDPFTVEAAYIGYGFKPCKTPELEAPLTFNGEGSVFVEEGYQSDECEIEIPENAWLCVRLKVTAEKDASLPSTDESASGGYRNGLRTLNVLRPNFIGCAGSFKETLIFFGDSVTQGTRTATDKYEAWSHRAGLAQDNLVNVINLGMGWSRAYDAAADGIFMKLAKYADKITVCFGVNDIKSGRRNGEQIIADLKKTVRLLKEHNPNVEIILFTVPPFNMEPWDEEQRQKVNRAVLSGEITEKTFDFGKILELSGGRVRPEYMSSPDDAHPNGIAGDAAARELIKILR